MAVHTDYDLRFKFKLFILRTWFWLHQSIHVKNHFWQKYSYFLLLRWSFHFPFPTLCGTPFTFPQFMTAKSSCPPASFGSPSNQFWKHQGEPSVQAPSAVQDPSFGCCLNPIQDTCGWSFTRKSLVALSVMDGRSPPWDLQDLSASCQVTWEGKCL